MSDWQPIETAPTDGTEVLVCFDEWGSPGARKMLAIAWHGHGKWMEGENYPPTSIHDPTHWMPLPDLPEADQ